MVLLEKNIDLMHKFHNNSIFVISMTKIMGKLA